MVELDFSSIGRIGFDFFILTGSLINGCEAIEEEADEELVGGEKDREEEEEDMFPSVVEDEEYED